MLSSPVRRFGICQWQEIGTPGLPSDIAVALSNSITASQNREDRTISLAAHRAAIRRLHEYLHLFGIEPIAQPNANSLRAFDPPNARCQLRAQLALDKISH
jgi:hypothetical protein